MRCRIVPVQLWYGLIAVVLVFASMLLQLRAQEVSLDPAKMPRIGGVDERFASYNIEMAEVTGGNFWKPYHSQSSAAAQVTQHAQTASTPAGINPNMYQYRPAIDLLNPRLRELAAPIGPAYVRVSRTWANSIYFADSDNPAGQVGETSQTIAAAAFSEEWLFRPEKINDYYASLRDHFEPGKPLWITETADAACGGNPWASTFLDTFRYLIEHASLARRGVKVEGHPAQHPRGERLRPPRPEQFGASPELLDGLAVAQTNGHDSSRSAGFRQAQPLPYAHCLEGRPGGVTLLVINADWQGSFDLSLPKAGERYTITARQLEDTKVELNGKPLRLTSSGDMPQFRGVRVNAGRLSVAPASITYLSIANAGNTNCQ